MLSRMVVVISVIYRARSKAEVAGPSGHAGRSDPLRAAVNTRCCPVRRSPGLKPQAKQHVPGAHPRLRRRSSGVGRSIVR
jgi:hypothetical protein